MTNSKEHCPVCGAPPSATYTLEHHKMRMNFCSEQCRENFQAHPALYSGKRSEENAVVIKHRKLRLSKPLDAAGIDKLNTYLHTLTGVKEAHAQGSRLAIRYDLLQLTLPQIERALTKSGFPLDGGWWPKLRRSWICNTEANELDNLAAPTGACCNRPPPRA